MPDDSAERPDQPAQQVSGAADCSSKRAADRFQIFEAIALERLQAGADATKPAAFLPLPVRLTAIAAAAIAGIGVVWSVVARVPVQVNGTAAIVPRSGMGSLVAATSGHLYFQVSGLAPETFSPRIQQQNMLLSRFWRDQARAVTSQVNQVGLLNRLVNTALLPVQGQQLFLPEDFPTQELFDQLGRRYLVTYPLGTLLARVVDPLAHQELNSTLLSTLPVVDLQQQQQIDLLKRSGQYRSLSKLQGEQRLVIARELQQRRELYQRLQQLWEQGFLPSTQLLEEQARINQLENQRLNSDSSQLGSSINSQDQITQSKQANIADIESRNKLENQLVAYLAKTAIFVPEGGLYLLATSYRDGSIVRQGDELMTFSTSPPELPEVVPVFLDGPTAQQVNEGMTVLVTPKGISRAEFGGIPGTVIKVAKLPRSIEGIIGAVGSRTLAESIHKLIPSPSLVIVRLQQAESNYCNQALSRRCYRWSTGRLPPHPVRLATLADVQITTTYTRPVDFVMPALRKALGLVVDNQ